MHDHEIKSTANVADSVEIFYVGFCIFATCFYFIKNLFICFRAISRLFSHNYHGRGLPRTEVSPSVHPRQLQRSRVSSESVTGSVTSNTDLQQC